MSNPARDKSSNPQRVSRITLTAQHIAKQNSVTSSHYGFSNATDLLLSLTMSHCNVSSRCFMQRLKPHPQQQFPEMPRKSTAFPKSMSGRFSRFEISFSCLLVLHIDPLHFQKYPGRIHLGFDRWTSPNVISFLGVVVHTAHEGQLQSFILDFIS